MDEKDKQLSSEANQEPTAAEQEENLEDVVQEAQKHTPGSKEQNGLVTRLIANLEKPGRLRKPKNTYQLSSNSYNEVHEVAKQELYLKIVEQIQNEKYNPQKQTVVNWVRFYQKKKFIDAQNEYLNIHSIQENGETRRIQVLSADNPVINSQSGDADESGISHLECIPQTPQDNMNPLLSQELVDLIKEDPGNIFSSKYMKNNPDANFKAIFLLRVEGYDWDEIASRFGISRGTINSFYSRSCQYFAPMFKEYLQQ